MFVHESSGSSSNAIDEYNARINNQAEKNI